MSDLWNAASTALVTYGGQVLIALLVLLGGWIFAGWIGGITRKALLKAKIDETLSKFLSKLARWMVLLLIILGCLSIFGVETTSFAS